MKKILLTALAALLLMPGTLAAQDKKADNAAKKDTTVFTVIKENPVTSVKNQNNSGTCWDFASMSFLESELLRMGKGTHDLSEAFVAYHTYMDRAEKSIRLHGDISFAQGGSFHDALYCLKHYGLAPQSAMPDAGKLYGDSLFNFNQLFATATAYVESLSKGKLKKITPTWKSDLSNIFKGYFGELPTTFKAENGKTYTPQSYAKDDLGLNADDYVSLTSFTHHPFYTQFAIEIPDNWRWGLSYNLPLNELMEVMDYAINKGYTVAWASDVTERYFGRVDGTDIARVPKNLKVKDLTGNDAAKWGGEIKDSGAKVSSDEELTITQKLRQEAFDNWETTDDHAMHIYGIAKDQKGTEYYMVKNSWGDYNKYHGMFYASKAYAAYKTINIVVHKSALPAAIAKKLGIK